MISNYIRIPSLILILIANILGFYLSKKLHKSQLTKKSWDFLDSFCFGLFFCCALITLLSEANTNFAELISTKKYSTLGKLDSLILNCLEAFDEFGLNLLAVLTLILLFFFKRIIPLESLEYRLDLQTGTDEICTMEETICEESEPCFCNDLAQHHHHKQNTLTPQLYNSVRIEPATKLDFFRSVHCALKNCSIRKPEYHQDEDFNFSDLKNGSDLEKIDEIEESFVFEEKRVNFFIFEDESVEMSHSLLSLDDKEIQKFKKQGKAFKFLFHSQIQIMMTSLSLNLTNYFFCLGFCVLVQIFYTWVLLSRKIDYFVLIKEVEQRKFKLWLILGMASVFALFGLLLGFLSQVLKPVVIAISVGGIIYFAFFEILNETRPFEQKTFCLSFFMVLGFFSGIFLNLLISFTIF